ncbi:ABC transporter substrate-binding protein [Glycomyces lechevalierae]|uniref:ABC transporter substrate-binding protein n=1 Tax=Glycomyces lechevalierae TaxID=256034 RepID=A0A9X3T6X2_9ACTN|nr:ABC transporter substrate-binding protein [Glycomyces lechevalierae]MDA1383563.1 ABC transporter substrate-binding protein [Glycomyces lechevalierae]MDR7341448.1 peptide/nickel transport system substrate-binding protein [Glycomyces lechevalierae]
MPVSRRSLLAAASAAPVLGLAACFSEGSEGAGATGRIRVAHMLPPRSGLSPLSDDAFKLSRWATAETLVVLDPDGNALPWLGTEWVQDGNTWTFTLREDVVFHDGTAFTAEAVANSLTVAAQAAPKPRILDGIDLTVAADGNTVAVTTAEADPLLPHRLSSPQLAILAARAYHDGIVDPVGAGTGAFVLTGVDGTVSASLDRNEDWWGGEVLAAGIDASFVPDGTARAGKLRAGEADIVESIPVSQAGLLEPGQITEVPMPRTCTLYLNCSTGPFTDPGVRAAAREAIDASSIVDGVYDGRADLAEGLLGPAIPWAAERDGRTAPATAADAAGTAITLGTFTDRAELPEVAQVLQQQLQDAGFTVELDIREYANIEADALDGAFDAFLLSRATVLDSGDPVAYLFSDFASEGSFNLSQFADDGVDAALHTASAAVPGAERRSAVLAAETAILNADAAIPLLHERVIQGDAAGVTGSIKDPRERELVGPETRVA